MKRIAIDIIDTKMAKIPPLNEYLDNTGYFLLIKKERMKLVAPKTMRRKEKREMKIERSILS